MQHRQHIDVSLGRNRINDQIWQPGDRELSRPVNLTHSSQHRKLPEHHRRLHDPADPAIRRAIIVGSDPVADRQQIIPRLRREINVQA
jgi:hypothetical protein